MSHGLFDFPTSYAGRSIAENPSLYRVYRTSNGGDSVIDSRSDPDDDPIVNVKHVDFKVKDNAAQHHTSKYDLTDEPHGQLIVRRGQSFDLVITLDRPFEEGKDDIRFVFFIGDDPTIDTKSLCNVNLLDKTSSAENWDASLTESTGNTLAVRIKSPADCAVGSWDLDIETYYKTGRESEPLKYHRYVSDQPCFILFNPWNSEDQVYMPSEEDLEEYVLNDKGKIATGNSQQIGQRAWNFGQFEEHVLLCASWLLDKRSGLHLEISQRGDPVMVSRAISSFCNEADNGGILIGNWSGDYEGGTKPTLWLGSVKILDQFWKTKQPVKYGQCWVFSGIVTSVCRTLGIPCRSVTNFSSAHDTNESTTIDHVIDEDGEPVKNENYDSVWNFHVWNDVWMARPDLEFGFGGWQAIDATPQELSQGVYCAGPSPLNAIKKGLVDIRYDTKFIFAEVNADRIRWMKKKDGSYDRLSRGKYYERAVGTSVKTKTPHVDRGLDNITLEYKFKEGTDEERAAVYMAARKAESEYPIYEHTAEDVVVEIVERDHILIGSPFDITVKLTNESQERRVVSGHIKAFVARYTGVVLDEIVRRNHDDVVLEPGESKELTVDVTFDDYYSKLVEQASIKQSVFMRVHDTKQILNEVINFRLRRPDVTLEVVGSCHVGEEAECVAILQNPLPRPLTNCAFDFEGPGGLQIPPRVELSNVPSGESARHVFKFTPKKEGYKTILSSFECNEFADVTGDVNFTVEPARSADDIPREARQPTESTDTRRGTTPPTESTNTDSSETRERTRGEPTEPDVRRASRSSYCTIL